VNWLDLLTMPGARRASAPNAIMTTVGTAIAPALMIQEKTTKRIIRAALM
jgi:hypothetical protein